MLLQAQRVRPDHHAGCSVTEGADRVGAEKRSVNQKSVLHERVFSRVAQDEHRPPAYPKHIFLTGGASAGVTPYINPRLHPTIPLVYCVLIPYYLDGTNGWSASVNEIRSPLEQTCQEGKNQPKALVIIRPWIERRAEQDPRRLFDIL